MTTRREIPLTGDTLAWVHTELAEIKSKLALIGQAAEQSRALATDAAETSHAALTKVDHTDPHGPAISNLQDEIRLLRDQIARVHDDITSLRSSREEAERRTLAESERERQDRNEFTRRFTEIQRQVDTWQERVATFEEPSRKAAEAAAQLSVKIDALKAEEEAINLRQGRAQSTLSRIDQEVTRTSALLPGLLREDDVHKERANSLAEMYRRLESEIETLKVNIGRIDRMDDRLELLMAERSRHGERIVELTGFVEEVQGALDAQAERTSLVEVRIGGFQDDLKVLDDKLLTFKEQIAAYLRAANDVDTDFRKRAIAALEKEMRDLRGRSFSLGEE